MNNKGIVEGDKLVAKKPIRRKLAIDREVFLSEGIVFNVKFADKTILHIQTDEAPIMRYQVSTGEGFHSEWFDEHYEKMEAN